MTQAEPPPGAATGLGSLPGTDPREAAGTVFGELPDLPHVPELPARGPGADVIGRTAAGLVGLHVDHQPSGWRLVPRPGREQRRAQAWLAEDFDAVEEAGEGFAGVLKTQLAGPWTLAAALELPRGAPALSDAGAVRDLVASLAETVRGHVAELARRVPGAAIVLQLDEPGLPAVLAGSVPTVSGLGRVPAVDRAVVQAALRTVVTAAEVPVVVHCCADRPPVALVTGAGASGVSLDALRTRLDRAGALDEELGAALESGVLLWAGLVPALGTAPAGLSDPAATVDPVRRLWRRLGLDPAGLAERVVVTPTCGLAGADPGSARAAMAAAQAAARVLVDDPEG